ncbi:DUF1634 domain-containing protein [Sulfurisphaera ohwakuensis]|uniref:DUF1634 domain-containing protein n=1 Tax=Sulfurisphaera ohwakuensis TaxID=69656 RepID=A0A650CJP0_SULOH|nr:DUF1634 domain-containing protein [Sulfurisphaera ohwakuensis]
MISLDEKKLISLTLRIGIAISSSLVILGLLLFLVTNSNYNIYNFNTSNLNLLNYSNPLAIILYGIIALISIPLLVVSEQIIIYLLEKDKIYVIISVLVFTIMVFAILVMPKIIMH